MSQPVQEVYVIRHGETEWSLSGRHTGLTDLPLTVRGRKTAELLRPVVAEPSFALILTSPLQRARHTCELAGLADQAQVTSDLEEWHYGDYEGLTTAQIHEQVPDWMIFSDGCPAGETPEQVRIRVDRLMDVVKATVGHVALFAHGHILRVFVARWLNFPVMAGGHFLLDTGTLNILSYDRGCPAVKRWNVQIADSIPLKT
jgi:probable phosphoglycerate mutase